MTICQFIYKEKILLRFIPRSIYLLLFYLPNITAFVNYINFIEEIYFYCEVDLLDVSK